MMSETKNKIIKVQSTLLIILTIGIIAWPHNIKADAITDPTLKDYQSVIEKLRVQKKKDSHLSCEYFFYDITGDSIPELWISVGTCEADTKLLVFTQNEGKSKKIYDGDDGHSDYFVYKGQLVSVMCNTGTGVVTTYKYDGKRIKASMFEFSVWNDEFKALSKTHDIIADEQLKFWEDNSDKYVVFKPL